jgi:hypothetical protein
MTWAELVQEEIGDDINDSNIDITEREDEQVNYNIDISNSGVKTQQALPDGTLRDRKLKFKTGYVGITSTGEAFQALDGDILTKSVNKYVEDKHSTINVNTIFKDDEMYNLFTAYESLPNTVSVRPFDCLNCILSLKNRDEILIEYEKYDKDEVLLLTNRMKLSEKLMICHSLGVNMLLIDRTTKQGWYTRAVASNMTLCYVLDNNPSYNSTPITFNSDDGKYSKQLHIRRAIVDPIVLRVLFQGECIDTKCFEPYSVERLPLAIETHYDFKKSVKAQISIKVQNYINLNLTNVTRQYKPSALMAGAYHTYAPKPQLPQDNLYDVRSYLTCGILAYNRHHDEKIELTTVRRQTHAAAIFDGVFYTISQAGNTIINAKQLTDDMKEQGYHYANSCHRLWLPEVHAHDTVVQIMRIYLSDLGGMTDLNGSTRYDLYDTLITVNAVIGKRGIVNYVVLTTTYFTRLVEEMLTHFVYKVGYSKTNEPTLKFNSTFGLCNMTGPKLEGIFPLMESVLECEGGVNYDSNDAHMPGFIYTAVIQKVADLNKTISSNMTSTFSDDCLNLRKVVKRKILNVHFGKCKSEIRNNKHINLDNTFLTVYRPDVIRTTCFNTSIFHYGYHPYIRDSNTTRINKRSKNTENEQHATKDQAKELSLSFTTTCYNDQIGEIIPLYEWNLLIMPCGEITTMNNNQINRHRCTFKYHAMEPRREWCPTHDLKDCNACEQYGFKHNSFKCKRCKVSYHSNIIAQLCDCEDVLTLSNLGLDTSANMLCKYCEAYHVNVYGHFLCRKLRKENLDMVSYPQSECSDSSCDISDISLNSISRNTP